jgi:hypothetical protein
LPGIHRMSDTLRHQATTRKPGALQIAEFRGRRIPIAAHGPPTTSRSCNQIGTPQTYPQSPAGSTMKRT